MRIKNEKLQQGILEKANEIIQASGLDSLNMRTLANNCNVALGTLYNYYQNKDAIVFAIAENFWFSNMHELRKLPLSNHFTTQLQNTYAFMQSRMSDFRSGPLKGLRQTGQTGIKIGKEKEQKMLKHLQAYLLHCLLQDTAIQCWSINFTPDDFALFATQNIFLSLDQNQPTIDYFIQICHKLLYLN